MCGAMCMMCGRSCLGCLWGGGIFLCCYASHYPPEYARNDTVHDDSVTARCYMCYGVCVQCVCVMCLPLTPTRKKQREHLHGESTRTDICRVCVCIYQLACRHRIVDAHIVTLPSLYYHGAINVPSMFHHCSITILSLYHPSPYYVHHD